MSGIEWPEESPEFDVWVRIWDGVQGAEEELEYLPTGLRELTKRIGKALWENRTKMLLNPKERGWIGLDSTLLENPWIRFATELEIADEGVNRAAKALEKYIDIVPAVASAALPQKAQRYVREVVHTYVFGFHPACIALCRAGLEQLLKERLISIGVYTVGQIRREKPTAGTVLEKAKQNALLPTRYGAAKAVIEAGDQLMHSHIADEKILQQLAKDSVRQFTDAAIELLGEGVLPSG